MGWLSNRVRLPGVLLVPGLISILVAATPGGWVPGVASAQVDAQESVEAEKAYWQDRYRRLRSDAVRLRREIEEAKAGYAAANRRNYRRGPVRHEYRKKMLEAEQELARVEKELSTFSDEARRAGALPGWLYEVEMEPVAVAPKKREPAGRDGTVGDDDEDRADPRADEEGDEW